MRLGNAELEVKSMKLSVSSTINHHKLSQTWSEFQPKKKTHQLPTMMSKSLTIKRDRTANISYFVE